MPVNGLYGHIRRNSMKSALLMALFVALIGVYWYAFCLGYSGLEVLLWKKLKARSGTLAFEAIAAKAAARALLYWYVPLIISTVWFAIAWRWHGAMIRYATGARAVERRNETKLYNLVENLAISAGLPMPRVEIMETSALNAYAAGLSPSTSTVAVTRGLLEALDDDELEAVLAHEITHIKNHDVRLMVVALIFAGGLTFLGNCVRSAFSGSNNGGIWIFPGRGGGGASHVWSEGDTDGDAELAGFGIVGAILSIVAAIFALILTHVLALAINFAISRSREFMADAGAVELTKNPDALISALNRICSNDDVPMASDSMAAMMISRNFDSDNFVESFFATHPAIALRVESLQKFAGGRVVQRRAPVRRREARAGVATSGAHMPSGAAQVGFAGGRATFGRRGAVPT